jgi:hypothetical protein
LSPGQLGDPFAEPPQAAAGNLHLLATLVELKRFSLLLFLSRLLALRVIADPEGCSYAVDLADTHAQIKTLSQSRLNR